jgi:hypothetical protein
MMGAKTIQIVCHKAIIGGTGEEETETLLAIVDIAHRHKLGDVVEGFKDWAGDAGVKYEEKPLPLFRKVNYEWEPTEPTEHMNRLIAFEWLFSTKKFRFDRPTGMGLYVPDKKLSDYTGLPR